MESLLEIKNRLEGDCESVNNAYEIETDNHQKAILLCSQKDILLMDLNEQLSMLKQKLQSNQESYEQSVKAFMHQKEVEAKKLGEYMESSLNNVSQIKNEKVFIVLYSLFTFA